VFGNSAHGEQFVHNARQGLGDVFDVQNQLVASSFGMLSYYYGGSADGQRGHYYNALAYEMCKHLGQLNNPVARRCLVTMALGEENCMARHKLIDKISKRQPTISINEHIFNLFIRITSEVSLCLGPADLVSLVKKLKETEQALKVSESAAFTAQDPFGISAVTNRILAYAARAHAFFSAGYARVTQEPKPTPSQTPVGVAF
jgi:hypothetical protein